MTNIKFNSSTSSQNDGEGRGRASVQPTVDRSQYTALPVDISTNINLKTCGPVESRSTSTPTPHPPPLSFSWRHTSRTLLGGQVCATTILHGSVDISTLQHIFSLHFIIYEVDRQLIPSKWLDSKHIRMYHNWNISVRKEALVWIEGYTLKISRKEHLVPNIFYIVCVLNILPTVSKKFQPYKTLWFLQYHVRLWKKNSGHFLCTVFFLPLAHLDKYVLPIR